MARSSCGWRATSIRWRKQIYNNITTSGRRWNTTSNNSGNAQNVRRSQKASSSSAHVHTTPFLFFLLLSSSFPFPPSSSSCLLLHLSTQPYPTGGGTFVKANPPAGGAKFSSMLVLCGVFECWCCYCVVEYQCSCGCGIMCFDAHSFMLSSASF